MKRRVEFPRRLDVLRTLKRQALHGNDPTWSVRGGAHWCAFRTADGPATVRYTRADTNAAEVEAWGPGAALALEAAPAHLGAEDEPDAFATEHPMVRRLVKRFPGFGFGRTGRVLEQLVPVIIGQKVTGKGAANSWRELLYRLGEEAPSADHEHAPRLWLMPEPARFRELAYFDFHPLGIERKRAQVILDVTRRARKIEAMLEHGADALQKRLLAFRGVGPWTTSIVRSVVCGDPDSVVVGDYNLPSLVTHAFTGEPRGDDDRMLELLEPFRPHRARVVSLIKMSGSSPPRFGPRLSVRNIRES